MMEKSCDYFEDLLVDYADEQLSLPDSNEVAHHLAKCEKCAGLLDALQRSRGLADVIWADGLSETENIRISVARRSGRFRWTHYASVAAGILLAAAAFVWFALRGPTETELTVTEIEREVIESGSAARLLAATELLSKHPEAEIIVERQYRNIVETYPETAAAARAKSKIQ